ncbi:hypothetical protein RUM44_002925 [Polyplax serrata]|uniref:Uncharacterized protein n=1 Tax=Polyplax serrata TaxID=468196 RepID=A0ABR1AX65_POLSC
MFRWLILILLITKWERSKPLLSSFANKLNKVTFIYPTGTQSERDLFICPENSACNIIHKRFWLPPLVERMCRCPQRHECKWLWTEEANNYTMMLDNRSQIKFCSDLSELPSCSLKKVAVQEIVKTSSSNTTDIGAQKNRFGQKLIKQRDQRNVTSFCHCKEPHYWKLRANSTKFDEVTHTRQQSYVCSKLKKCISKELCGYIRTDTYSTYYRCSCPKGHMCISKDKTLYKMEEMLFNGRGYKAFCYPVKN